jgi:hypothetical protein
MTLGTLDTASSTPGHLPTKRQSGPVWPTHTSSYPPSARAMASALSGGGVHPTHTRLLRKSRLITHPYHRMELRILKISRLHSASQGLQQARSARRLSPSSMGSGARRHGRSTVICIWIQRDLTGATATTTAVCCRERNNPSILTPPAFLFRGLRHLCHSPALQRRTGCFRT